MFGHKAKPTVIFLYGCRILPEYHDRSVELLRLANRYRNKLCELERLRRDLWYAAAEEFSPDISTVYARENELTEQLKTAETAIDRLRAKARARRVSIPEELRTQCRTLRRELKAVRAHKKELQAALKAIEAWTPIQAALSEAHHARLIEARGANNLPHGTYLHVERSCGKFGSGTPPQFKRFQGEGVIYVQTQKGPAPEQLFNGECPIVQLEHLPREGSRQQYYRLRMRLRDRGTREFIEATVHYTRPLPPDSSIRGASLVCKRVGPNYKWTLQLQVSRESGWQKPHGEGRVAVNLGWRQVVMDDGEPGMRVAYWKGDDGRKGSLILPLRQATRLDRSRTLQSTMDKNMDLIRRRLVNWKQRNPLRLPDWFVEQTETLAQWKASRRLAGLVIRWRTNRFSGDESIYEACEEWRKQAKHLWSWEAHNGRRHINWRKTFYHRFSARLRRQFGELLIAKVDWAGMSRKLDILDDSDEAWLLRRRKNIAAPSELQTWLAKQFPTTRLIDPHNLTTTCAACGELSGQLNQLALMHRCVHCGVSFDQDENHCDNLLANRNEVLQIA